MVVADRSGRAINEAGGYGKRLRVGLHFTQLNLRGSLSLWHLALTQSDEGDLLKAKCKGERGMVDSNKGTNW